MLLRDYFNQMRWELVHEFELKGKAGLYRNFKQLGLSSYAEKFLSEFSNGIYSHQYIAIKKFLQGENVSVATSTASGKSLIFQICALEIANKNPNAKILAVYPLKALAHEQEIKWNELIKKCGINAYVGRIDGSVAQSAREKIIKTARILIMTPDVIHAWLLSKCSSSAILNFIKDINLIIIDEAHNYSGVFGTNSAYLFRRLLHIIGLLDGKTQLIASSATIKNPQEHLMNLTGEKFYLIGPTEDGSPKKDIKFYLINPPQQVDLFSSLSQLMKFILQRTSYRFITFVDSRKQTEYIANITTRKEEKDDEVDEKDFFYSDLVKGLPICPYRAGYEEIDRQAIQERLTNGELRGVISTSALEMGIDIPYINLGILVGIPHSATSFYQRIGRIGRHQEGIILIINDSSIITETIFRHPERLLKIPLSESSLYLDNKRIQYIHALCLARQGGEDDTVKSYLGIENDDFSPQVNFPENFLELCHLERIGEISTEFQTMKAQAGEDPHHVYPLRDVDIQFKVEYRRGPQLRHLGSLSYSQVMREAYPGAVYYYQTQAFRVYRVNTFKRLIEVRSEKKYTTKPNLLPTLIFPNLSEGNILTCKKFGDLIIVECNLQIRESIAGFTETRGRNEIQINYPLDKTSGLYFDLPRFTRNYFTTGIIINHPILNNDLKNIVLAEILYEAFLLKVPFERQDISFGTDKHRAEREYFSKDSRFISIYDQTYGSLRLTSKFLEHDITKSVFKSAIEIANNDFRYRQFSNEIKALNIICEALELESTTLTFKQQTSVEDAIEQYEKIILPNSVGLDITSGRNEEFFIEDVFYHPKSGLSYKGRHLSETSKRYTADTPKASAPIIIVPVRALVEIPGESRVGYYNYETGEIIDNISLK